LSSINFRTPKLSYYKEYFTPKQLGKMFFKAKILVHNKLCLTEKKIYSNEKVTSGIFEGKKTQKIKKILHL
jgi:hypothetical protein